MAAADPALLYRPSMRVEAGTLTNLEPTHGCEREVGREREGDRGTQEDSQTNDVTTTPPRERRLCSMQVHADYRDHANF